MQVSCFKLHMCDICIPSVTVFKFVKINKRSTAAAVRKACEGNRGQLADLTIAQKKEEKRGHIDDLTIAKKKKKRKKQRPAR